MENGFELLSVKQVAKVLNVSKFTVYYYIKERGLKAFRVGKHWRIPKKHLLNFISERNKREEIY